MGGVPRVSEAASPTLSALKEEERGVQGGTASTPSQWEEAPLPTASLDR